ncbi:hypothetical protein M885DRAFT_618517 [Pelagophyceae sp. CCMP2097]|nr:hypothetical protein M885DRAFT_618517 [Pelagophyceae sp. CCMP2097]|mmetsp:Transcript_13351/g.46432  ORF Transcript_13351/g.46432 Transcript_13351/m.46432 type:complete len:346 (+) Transcript_13351:86-1123(+)
MPAMPGWLLLCLAAGAGAMYGDVRAQARMETRWRASELVESVSAAADGALYEPDVLTVPSMDWPALPDILQPSRFKRGDERARARNSVAAFVQVCHSIMAQHGNLRLVDACAGDGDLLLPIVAVLGCKGLGVDIEQEAVTALQQRAAQAGVDVATAQHDAADLEALLHDGDVVIGLRACGSVADLAVRAAIERRVPFVLSPCCLWKALQQAPAEGGNGRLPAAMGSARPTDLWYPRSEWLQSRLAPGDFALLAAADDSIALRSSAMLGDGSRSLLWRQAQRIIEHDRVAVADESGFETRVLRFPGGDNAHTAIFVGVPTECAWAIDALRSLETTPRVDEAPLFSC